ncbi:MAG: NAD(P)-binding protein [Saprospiraceae bacterium]|nr:NAD(P)-binding protein [Saprospiraceae bacterium]
MVNERSKPTIHIIGAGISGLICAWELEQKGFSPIIIEKNPDVGGRLQTVSVGDYALDRGFQVLLTAYPAVKRYLDLDALKLKNFLAGAAIRKNKVLFQLADPLRHPALWKKTLDFPFATSRDKLLIIKLVLTLRLKTVRSIFGSREVKTLDYLSSYGFSQQFIQSFFLPFFSGIFLENKLETSSRMFEFVLKMFIEGNATVPSGGIQQIPLQLKSRLKNTSFLFNTTVSTIAERVIKLIDQRQLATDYLVIATDPAKILPDYPTSQPIEWQHCQNLYFKVGRPIFTEPLLGLIADEDSLINNFHFINSGEASSIISVTIVKTHRLEYPELVRKVKEEISELCPGRPPELIESFNIDHALPIHSAVEYAPVATKIRIANWVFLAGDHMANPSLNGAMESGKAAADLLYKVIKGN